VSASQVVHGRGSLIHAVPIALHTCGVLPEHRFEPGWQIPMQLPAEQTFAQAPVASFCQ
jgi:hypothetical protein